MCTSMDLKSCRALGIDISSRGGENLLLLSNDDVQSILDMRQTMAALRIGYEDLKNGEATYGPRIDYFLPTGRSDDYYRWGNMVGASASFGVVAVRMKSQVMNWPDQGATQDNWAFKPGLFCGFMILFSCENGEPLALIHDGYLQHMRVGGSMGIGVDLLARENAATVGLIGSGGMAHTFLEAFVLARPIRSVKVFSPTPGHRESFALEMSERLGLEVVAVDTAEEAVRDALVVASATDSMSPTFDPTWLSNGSHVVLVTRRELGNDLLDRADVTVQLGVNTIPFGTPVPMLDWKAGGISAYVAGKPEDRERIPSARRSSVGEFPTMLEVETGKAPGRTSDDQVTLFVGTGTQGLQFASVGGYVYREAKSRGIGRELPSEWFLQDIRD